ncbi:hybrid sensor histidine kinase/response regulator [Candidatus Albibeggiatoa sp. nov. NOAA]|uniref:hybrid sensor histidine kinase/response regulator n=1 Tax=Candidatus Albibeggiatoa sp. nov. NOAA TaxID=3162724 RepID=UPI00330310DD|nr:hybrid sensor histidine kinase/response regulator [Thiotrichaceae bacterium]
MSNTESPNILVVDDTPANLDVLKNILKTKNYQVRPIPNGALALRAAQAEPPDLILLDVMMPGMSGFEVCTKLKADEHTQHIPVIFISALQETKDKVKAFNAGGIDFITKPFQAEEVLARVTTHLALARAQCELQDSYQRLEAQNAELIQLNQEKNEFLGIAAHDLKNPLSAIKGWAEEIEEDYDAMEREELIDSAKKIKLASQKMHTLTTNLLDVNAIESGKIDICLDQVDVCPIIANLSRHYSRLAKAKDINLTFHCGESAFPAYVDANLTHQVLDNLISNAVKYSPLGKRIDIRLLHKAGKVRCEVQDQGAGLSEVDKQKLFGKFSRLSARPTAGEHSTGLGLFIVKKLTSVLHGEVWCESEEGKGACFILELPAT